LHCQNAGDRTSSQHLNFYCTLARRRNKKKLRRDRAAGSQTSGTSAMRERCLQA